MCMSFIIESYNEKTSFVFTTFSFFTFDILMFFNQKNNVLITWEVEGILSLKMVKKKHKYELVWKVRNMHKYELVCEVVNLKKLLKWVEVGKKNKHKYDSSCEVRNMHKYELVCEVENVLHQRDTIFFSSAYIW